MEQHTILWRRLDLPGHEASRLFMADDRRHLSGTTVFLYERQPCRLDYLVICDAGWRILAAHVAGWVGDREIDISIEADADLRWRLNCAEREEVEGCRDLDLNFSPATNLLPLRRLGLEIGQAAEVRAAWLRFPIFRLESLDQRYSRTSAD